MYECKECKEFLNHLESIPLKENSHYETKVVDDDPRLLKHLINLDIIKNKRNCTTSSCIQRKRAVSKLDQVWNTHLSEHQKCVVLRGISYSIPLHEEDFDNFSACEEGLVLFTRQQKMHNVDDDMDVFVYSLHPLIYYYIYLIYLSSNNDDFIYQKLMNEINRYQQKYLLMISGDHSYRLLTPLTLQFMRLDSRRHVFYSHRDPPLSPIHKTTPYLCMFYNHLELRGTVSVRERRKYFYHKSLSCGDDMCIPWYVRCLIAEGNYTLAVKILEPALGRLHVKTQARVAYAECLNVYGLLKYLNDQGDKNVTHLLEKAICLYEHFPLNMASKISLAKYYNILGCVRFSSESTRSDSCFYFHRAAYYAGMVQTHFPEHYLVCRLNALHVTHLDTSISIVSESLLILFDDLKHFFGLHHRRFNSAFVDHFLTSFAVMEDRICKKHFMVSRPVQRSAETSKTSLESCCIQ